MGVVDATHMSLDYNIKNIERKTLCEDNSYIAPVAKRKLSSSIEVTLIYLDGMFNTIIYSLGIVESTFI
jgi:hypothetical protein